jgi:uncharacterized protein (DUF362 family)
MTYSRRQFLRALGSTTAGLLIAPYLKSSNIFAYGHDGRFLYGSQVALTQADNYDQAFIKARVQHLFESIGGISDVVKPGMKVAIKINLTGGSGSSTNRKLNGLPITESMWTHPEVLRAVGELILDCGVLPSDLFFLESLWDAASYNDFGYLEVQQSLGAQFVNLNSKAPYSDFVQKDVGDKRFYYSSFTMNQVLSDIDVYVSIPKLKQHYDAGVTASLKNQVGSVPMLNYVMPSLNDGRRSMLHYEGGDISFHLPHSICDLNLARPVHLAVIDGVRNARGGEGVWNPTFQTHQDNVLMAGKDPVATDSVAAYLMGNNPEAATFQLPDGVRQCDNYLDLLRNKGVGTNLMSEIELVGDGAGMVTAVQGKEKPALPTEIQLYQNYPNPFNPSTTIAFSLPHPEHIRLTLHNIVGQEIETLVDGEVPAGQHTIRWNANGLASGIYIYRLQAGRFVVAKKMIYQK